MTEYRVTWEIDTDQETPLDAAEYALQVVSRPESIAHVFTVTDRVTGAEWVIDFDAGRPDTEYGHVETATRGAYGAPLDDEGERP
jgi:hypothetical protein